MLSIKNVFKISKNNSKENLIKISEAISHKIASKGADVLRADENRIEYRVDLLRTLTTWSPLLGISFGSFDFVTFRNQVRVISRAQYTLFVVIGTLITLLIGFFLFVKGSSGGHIFGTMILIWLFLVGFNLLIAIFRFRGLVENSIDKEG